MKSLSIEQAALGYARRAFVDCGQYGTMVVGTVGEQQVSAKYGSGIIYIAEADEFGNQVSELSPPIVWAAAEIPRVIFECLRRRDPTSRSSGHDYPSIRSLVYFLPEEYGRDPAVLDRVYSEVARELLKFLVKIFSDTIDCIEADYEDDEQQADAINQVLDERFPTRYNVDL